MRLLSLEVRRIEGRNNEAICRRMLMGKRDTAVNTRQLLAFWRGIISPAARRVARFAGQASTSSAVTTSALTTTAITAPTATAITS